MRSLALLLGFFAAAPASPATGTWQGVFHGGRTDQPLVLVLRARPAGALAGELFLDGAEFGALEDGTLRGDSLLFRVGNHRFAGRRAGTHVDLTLFVPNGSTHAIALTFASPDTTAPAGLAPTHRAAVAPWATVPDSVFARHLLPAGTPVGHLPCLDRGTLFLVGGGPSQRDLDARFVELAGGPDARIVLVPTASLDDPDSAADPDLGPSVAHELGVAHVTVLHARSRKEADSEEFVKPLSEATGVWLTGGEASYLMARYLGTRTERELEAVLDRGGVVGGTSAGALVWASSTLLFRGGPGSNPYGHGRPEDVLLDSPRAVGFGVLRDVLVQPHFTQFQMAPSVERAVSMRPDLLAIGVDEATVFEVHGDLGIVRGRGGVTVYDGGPGASPRRLGAGARYDLHRHAVP